MNHQAGTKGGRRIMATIALAAATSLAVLSVPTAANAYTTTGCHWNSSSTINYKNNGSGSYTSIITNSANSWDSGTPLYLQSTANAALVVYQTNAGNSGYEGYTTWYCSGGITSGTSSYANTYYTASYPTNKIRAVLTHEIGHALGLNHSGVAGAIMSSSAGGEYDTYGHYTPQTDDKNGINAIY